MTRIVSNTGPVIALDRVGLLGLLDGLFDAVLVPAAVEREFLAGAADPGSFLHACASGVLDVEHLVLPLDPLLQGLLDEGEASVIQLARERNLRHVLIDERKGGQRRRPSVADAKRAGLIETIRGPLEGMRTQGYRIHEAIVQAARVQAG